MLEPGKYCEDRLRSLSRELYNPYSKPNSSRISLTTHLIVYEHIKCFPIKCIKDICIYDRNISRCLLSFWVDVKDKKSNQDETKNKKNKYQCERELCKIALIFEFNFIPTQIEYDFSLKENGCKYEYADYFCGYLDCPVIICDVYHSNIMIKIVLRTLSFFKEDLFC
ncbi:MAG: hypothetical protein QW303_03515 [Nitrososphaerota archaeon]